MMLGDAFEDAMLSSNFEGIMMRNDFVVLPVLKCRDTHV